MHAYGTTKIFIQHNQKPTDPEAPFTRQGNKIKTEGKQGIKRRLIQGWDLTLYVRMETGK